MTKTFLQSYSRQAIVEKAGMKMPKRSDIEGPRRTKGEERDITDIYQCNKKAYEKHLASLTSYPFPVLKENDGKEISDKEFYLQIQDFVDGEWIDRIEGDYINFNGDKSKRRIVAMKIIDHCQCDACKDGVLHASDCGAIALPIAVKVDVEQAAKEMAIKRYQTTSMSNQIHRMNMEEDRKIFVEGFIAAASWKQNTPDVEGKAEGGD